MGRVRGWERRSALVVAALAVATIPASLALANADTWKTATNGNWEVGSNWTDGTTPNVADTATFNVFGSFTATFGISPAAIQNLAVLQGTVVLTSSGGAKTLNVTAAGTQDLNVSGANTGLFVGTSGNPLHINVTDDLSVASGATMQAGFGSHITASDLSTAGLNGTLRIDGAGSTLALTGLAANNIGTNGGTGSLVFQNSSTGNSIASDVYVASGAAAGTGTVSVTGGSNVTLAGNLYLAASGVAGTTGTLNINGANSTLTQTGYAGVTVGALAGGSAAINLGVATSGGALNTGGGGLSIGPTGSVNIGGGSGPYVSSLNSGGPVNIYGGGTGNGLTVASGSSFGMAPGNTMTIMQGGQATFGGGHATANNAVYTISDPGSKFAAAGALQIVGGTSMQVVAGATLSGSNIDVASGGTSDALVVDGAGSSAVATTGISTWGLSGGTANVTFRNNATGTFTGGIVFAPSLYPSVGNLNVQSGAHLTVGPLSLVNAPGAPYGAPPSATVTVTDLGSSVNLTPGSGLSMGDVYGNVATLNVHNGATFTVGTGGSTTLYAGSVININGGVVDLKSLTNNGGTVNLTAGSLSFVGNLTAGTNGLFGTNPTITSSQAINLTGTTTVDAFRSLTLNGGTLNTGTLNVNGTFNFNSGTLGITGGTGLSIGTGGVLGASLPLGAGRNLNVTALTSITSTGILYLNGGAMAATGGITNAGEIQILDPISQLTGGTITNNKLITGNGRITNNLANNAAGEVRASATQRLTFAGATNTNAGKINMVNGGTVEFTGALTNSATGVITGRGALITSSLTNSGQVQISAGLTDVYGPVTTNSGGKVIVSGGGTATFYNAVTMNAGSEFRVSAGSTAVFFGPVTSVGLFTGTGAKFFEAGASAPGSLATDGTTFVDAPASLNVDYFREASLTVSGTASTNPGSPTSVLGTLAIDSGATLDMANNKLVLNYTGASPIDTVRQYLLSSRLISSTAIADPQHRLAIAYAEASLLGVSTWGGVVVDSTAVLTKLTYFGDANMDGIINADDFALIDRGFAKGLTGWTAGDFNYDNAVTSADYLLIDRVYVQQGAPLSPDLLAMRESQFGAEYVQSLIASVPEPASLAGLFVAVPLFTRRRRGC